jgi:hypothetical protein
MAVDYLLFLQEEIKGIIIQYEEPAHNNAVGRVSQPVTCVKHVAPHLFANVVAALCASHCLPFIYIDRIVYL